MWATPSDRDRSDTLEECGAVLRSKGRPTTHNYSRQAIAKSRLGNYSDRIEQRYVIIDNHEVQSRTELRLARVAR
jgi:hypothetical protein